MSDQHVNFRAPDELVEHVEAVADALDVSKSEAWREATRRGLADVADDAEGLDHVAFENRIDTIRREAKPEQMEAWFRNRASSHLLRCWNGNLTPEEARKSMNGYLRAATEEYGRQDYREYVEEGLSLYADAYQRSNAHIIVNWCKQRVNAGKFDTDAPGGFESEEAIPDDTPDENTSTLGTTRTYRQAVEDRVGWVESGLASVEDMEVPDDVDTDAETFRDDVQRVIDADDADAVELRGEADE